jgi:hypothetical protein
MTLPIALRAEILKTKKSASFYLAVFGAAFSPFMTVMDTLTSGIDPKYKDQMFHLLISQFQIEGGILLPFFIMLVCTLLPQMEYRNNTWKQIFASPQSKGNIFFAKFINAQRLVLLFIVLHLVFVFVAAVLLYFVYPSLHLFSQRLVWREVIMNRVNAYLTILAMFSIQFWMGLRLRNFVVSLAIGLACWFIGIILAMEFKSPAAQFFPHAFSFYPSFKELKDLTPQIVRTSLIFSVVILGLAYFDFTRNQKKKL